MIALIIFSILFGISINMSKGKGEKLLNVSYSGAYLTIEAVNEYQRFRKVNIEKFDKDAYDKVFAKLADGSIKPIRTIDVANADGYATADELTKGLSLAKVTVTVR